MATVERGPHPTARTQEAIDLFEEDIAYQVKAGFAQVIPWEEVKRDFLAGKIPNLKISPVAAIPQENRRPRIILDLSFGVCMGRKKIQESINSTSHGLAPSESLEQLGQCMPRTFQYLADVPLDCPVYFSKYDISDGYWRMVVAPGEEYNFAYVLLQAEGKPAKLVIPSAIQMGWKESPAFFCGATETARDVVAAMAGVETPGADELPEHPLEHRITFLEALQAAHEDPAEEPYPWANIELFIDDFMLMSSDVAHFWRLSQAALHGIHSVFPPPSVTEHKNGKEPMLIKKLVQGDGDWAIKKVILGWLLDGVACRVSLYPNKAKSY